MMSLRKATLSADAASRRTAPAPAGLFPLDLPGRLWAGLFKLPPAAWTRLWLLFSALVLVKLAIVAALGRHLYEMHWRTDTSDITWVNFVAFGVLVALGVASLVRLGHYCKGVGVNAVRASNAIVLGLGLAFIFLTFHTGEKNYLYPILTQVLKWNSLGPYLALDFFFRQPFLAAWLFGYLSIYYLLARTGREASTVYLTAACAGAYGLVCLRELLVYRDELLVADCFGLVWLALTRRANRKLPMAWLLAPVAWSLVFAILILRLALPLDGYTVTYFSFMLGIAFLLFGMATLVARKYGFLASWSNLLLFYFSAFLLLTDANYPLAVNYNHLLCLAFGFSRYFAGELLLVVVVALAASLYCKVWPRAGLWWLDMLSLLLIVVAFIDFRLSQIMGVRLQWDVLAFSNSPKMMWRMAKPYLPGATFALAGAALLYILFLQAIRAFSRNRTGRMPSDFSTRREVLERASPLALSTWRSAPAASKSARGLAHSRTPGRETQPEFSQPPDSTPSHGLLFVTGCFITLMFLGMAIAEPDKAQGQAELSLLQTNPLWKRATHKTLGRAEFLASATALGLGDLQQPGAAAPGSSPRALNVLLVFMESSYNKHLSLFGGAEETQPLLSKYKERMEIFPNFFSDFAGSIQARFATFTSLYPVRDFNSFTLQRVAVKSIFEVLHDNGYHCSMFYSSSFDYTGFGDFLQQRGIDEMYDADNLPGKRSTERVSWGVREEETLGAIRSQIKKHAAGRQPFFLTYVPAAPHYPYDAVPPAFKKFKMNEPGDYTPMYLNELLYMDWVLASIVDQLKDSGLLDSTVVIITNDHGERTGAHGEPIGHGWSLTPELANTPLIIMDPRQPGYRLNYAIGSQVDLLPTLLERLGLPIPEDQLYQGRSLAATNSPGDRLTYLNTYQQFGVLTQNRIIIGDRQAEEAHAPASKQTAYLISNQGSKTMFTEEPAPPTRLLSIHRFDEFQEGLLHNYSLYCAAVLKARRPTETAAR